MDEQMKQAIRQAEETVAAISSLWETTPPRTCSNGIRLPSEIRDLAQVARFLLEVVGQQQEVMAAQQGQIAKLKERLGS